MNYVALRRPVPRNAALSHMLRRDKALVERLQFERTPLSLSLPGTGQLKKTNNLNFVSRKSKIYIKSGYISAGRYICFSPLQKVFVHREGEVFSGNRRQPDLTTLIRLSESQVRSRRWVIVLYLITK